MSKDRRFFPHVTLKGYLGVFLLVSECFVCTAIFFAVNAVLLLAGVGLGFSTTAMVCGLTALWLLIFFPLVLSEVCPDYAEWTFDEFVRRYGLRKRGDRDDK